jgi:hypothetical protein
MQADITQVTNLESSKLGERGTLEATIRTSFKVQGQGPFSIELPKAGWTAAAADKAIQEYASQIVTLRDKYPGT